MAYTPIPTKGLGDILPAQNWNDLVENVVSGPIGLATAAGDLFQATGLNAMARVAIGPAASVVRANSTPNGIEYAETLTSTPSDLTDSSDDDKMVQFGVLRTTFLPRLTNVGYRAFTADGSFNWDWNTTVGYLVIASAIPPSLDRLSGSDITLGTGSWQGGASDGSTIWFVDDTTNRARAYRASDGARLSSADITLAPFNWRGGASDGSTLWFISASGAANAYRASDGARLSSADITLGTGSWQGGTSDGSTIWFVDDTTNMARAYRASDGARLSSADITLGTGRWRGGASDGLALWFIDDTTNRARAYRASDGARLSSADITLGTEIWRGGTSDGSTLWFINDATSAVAVAYEVTEGTSVSVGTSTYVTDIANPVIAREITGITANTLASVDITGAVTVLVAPVYTA